MGARRSRLVVPISTDWDEDGCEREGSTPLYRGERLPTYGVGGGI